MRNSDGFVMFLCLVSVGVMLIAADMERDDLRDELAALNAQCLVGGFQ